MLRSEITYFKQFLARINQSKTNQTHLIVNKSHIAKIKKKKIRFQKREQLERTLYRISKELKLILKLNQLNLQFTYS